MSFTAAPVSFSVPLPWVVVLVAVWYLCYRRNRFRNTGVKYRPSFPLLGDITKVVFGVQNVNVNFEEIYASFLGERFVGMFESIRPVVVVRDLELAKRITVKDFDHFQNHSVIIDGKVDPVFGRMLFAMQGQDWREMRYEVSRFFTSFKLGQMVLPMVEAGDRMVGEIRRKIQRSKANYWDTDFDTLGSQYNFDIIVSCTLGLRRDNSSDLSPNLLRLKSSHLTRLLGFQIFPNFMKVIGAKIFAKSTTDFFKKLFIRSLKSRKDKTSKGPDFIDIILQSTKVWSDDDWYAQAVALLVAGFDPVAAALGMLVHELAVNPEVQERLAREVLEADRRNGGKIDYTSIQELTYMDMAVSEMLRMWTNSTVDRVCTEDYNLGRPNDSATQDYIIRKGEGLYIPMGAIHYDPQYFPEPTKFDPERFSKENRHKIPPLAYNPFGMGLRMCIGSRFAICVIKVLIYQLLRDVKMSPCEKTSASVQLHPATVEPRIKGGCWVRLTLRR